VPREVVEQWLKYLRNVFPTVAFKSSTGMQRHKITQSSVPVPQASDSLLQSNEYVMGIAIAWLARVLIFMFLID